MRLDLQTIFNNPFSMGLKRMILDYPGLFMSLQELSRIDTSTVSIYCTILLPLYGCTGVQDQYGIVVLYYCITSLPVYPHTVLGHCTTVVLDTSNRVYCRTTTLKVYGTV